MCIHAVLKLCANKNGCSILRLLFVNQNYHFCNETVSGASTISLGYINRTLLASAMETMDMNQRLDGQIPIITAIVSIPPQEPIVAETTITSTDGATLTNLDEVKSSSQHDKDKKDRKREAIDSQAREIIFKVIKFFESEKRNRGYAYPVENVMKRASAATGLSESTIKRIKRDGLKAEATNTKMTGPKKKRVRRTKVQLDYYQLCALRAIVNGYANRKEVPTLTKILSSARSELNYAGGKESLRLILLNKLGIKFKKCEKKPKKEPSEQPPVQVQPQQHIQVTMQNQMPIQQQQQQQQQIQNQPVLIHHHHHQMQMKPIENHCVYTHNSVMPSALIGL